MIDLTTTSTPTEFRVSTPAPRRPAAHRGQLRTAAVAVVATAVAVALAMAGSIALTSPQARPTSHAPASPATTSHAQAPHEPATPSHAGGANLKTTSGQPVPTGLQQAIANHLGSGTRSAASRAAERALHVRSTVSGEVRVASGGHVFTVTPTAFGRGTTEPLGTTPRVGGHGTSYDYGALTEWYHQPQGASVEDGFTVSQRPAGSGAVTISMTSAGNVFPVVTGPHSLALRAGAATAFTDTGLRVTDATGRVLPSHFAVSGRTVDVAYDDAGATYPVTVDPWVQTGPLDPNSGAGSYGYAVTISSDGLTALVGDPGAINGIGSATVFYDDTGNWSAGTSLLVPNTGLAFGSAVALSSNGGTALVGDPEETTADQSATTGAAYVYTLSGDTWSPPTELTLPASASAFGTSVSLSGDGLTALIGDPDDSSGIGAGEAWVYTSSGGVWSTSPVGLTVPATASVYGTSVALASDGTSAVVGDPGGGAGTGAATVYSESGGVWTAGLSPTPPTTATTFGYAVAIDANATHVVSGDPGGGTGHHGAATLYGFSAGVWHSTNLTAISPQAFGTAVSIAESDAMVAVGDPTADAVRTYTQSSGWVGLTFTKPGRTLNYGSSLWLDSVGTELVIGDPSGTASNQTSPTGLATFSHFQTGVGFTGTTEFNEPGGPSAFGTSVAMSSNGQTAIVGDDTGGALLTGAAYIYTFANGAWDGGSMLSAPINAVNLGTSVAISGDGVTALVGDFDGGAGGSGAATIYTLNGKTWVEGANLAAPGTAGEFGQSVALDGNGAEAIVGDPLDESQFDGAANVYTLSGGVWSAAVMLPQPVSASFFGAAVSLSSSGATALVGDYGDEATVFTLSGGVWSPGTPLFPPAHSAVFGASVSLDAAGTEAMIGDPEAKPSTVTGAATVYTETGSTWSAGVPLALPAGSKTFGSSVQLSGDGNTALVGDAQFAVGAVTTGAAWAYTLSGGTWSSATGLTAPANAINFGTAVALNNNGSGAIVGDPFGDPLGFGAATAYSLGLPKLAFTTTPITAAAGTSAVDGPITVQLESAAGTPMAATSPVTVNLATTSSGGVFSASPTGTPTTTSVTIGTSASSVNLYYGDSVAGTPTITASATGLDPGTQVETITPGPATHLVVTSSSTASTGTALPVTVTAEDQFDNTVTGYTGTVHFTSSDGAAVLPANYTFVSGDAGVHVFSVTFNTLGAQTVTATDTVTSSITGTDDVSVLSGTTTTPGVSPNTVIGGNNVTYSATVASGAGTPTGTVTFTIDSVEMCAGSLASGHTSCVSNLAPTGSDLVTASYGGDSNFSPSSNTTSLTVNPPLSITTTSLSDGTVGVNYNPSDTPTLAATGGQSPYSGWAVATSSPGPLPPGLSIDASSGAITGTPTTAGTYDVAFQVTDSESLPVTVTSGTLSITVDMGTPDVTAQTPSPATANVGQSVTYSATVTGGGVAPTGTVTFSIGGTTLCPAAVSAGTASCSAGNAPVGTNETVTATYGGDTNYNGGSSTTTITVVVPASAYTAVNPYRVCDTRGTDGLVGTNAQCAGDTLPAGGTLTIQVSGTNPSGTSTGGVPASGVAAVVLNVTATGEASQGYVTVWPAGETQPTASSLNYKANKTVPNLVTVGLSASGQVSFYSLASTNLVVDVEGYYSAPSGTAGLFNSVTPYRICDTRGPEGLVGTNAQCASHTLSGGQTLTIEVSGTNPSGTSSGGVPSSGVSAVVLNVTAIGHGTGYLTVFPQGVTAPTASNLNFSSGQVVPNRVIVPVSATGQVSLTTNTSVDVAVDVNGWFTDGSSPAQTGAEFVATSPSRICDTRSNGNATPCAGHTVAGGTFLDVGVAGQGPVPSSGVVAVVANVTATDTTAQSYLTAWPAGLSRPTASDLNWVAGLTVPNMAVVGLGAGGDMSVYVANGSADVIVDVTGYYVNEA